MHLVAASWLMTSLSGSAALVALVQTATSLPVVVLALPGGTLADVLDRRRMIIATQAWQVLVAAALAVLTLADATTPAALLALTFALGAGAALGLPVLLATVPHLVPRQQLGAAVSLNSAGFTLAQALGPAVGGVLVSSLGAGAVFVLNAVSFLGVAAVAAVGLRPAERSGLPPEHVLGAIRTGVRYLRHARPLQVVLVRVASHVLFFSAFPALLVVVSRTRLGLDASAYGAMYGCFGAGGVIGALLLPRARSRIHIDRLVPLGALCLALGILALGTLTTPAALYPFILLAGVGSMTVISSLTLAAQSVLPAWVRGRGLSIHILTFQAGMAGGAALWGAFATRAGLSTALVIAGAGLIAVQVVARLAGLRLAVAEDVDLTPAPWIEPEFAFQPDLGEGPIQVEIEYRIAEEDSPEFLESMAELRRNRRRDGAMRWSLYRDISDPERHVESFLVSSWAEHERQPERAVTADRAAIERVLALHHGEGPHVRHLLSRDVPSRRR